MTEAAEEARAEAKAMAVWRVEEEAALKEGAARAADGGFGTTLEDADLRAEETASLPRCARRGGVGGARRAEREAETLRAAVRDAEADARAAWTALDAERSSRREEGSRAETKTPAGPGPAEALLSLVSPSLLLDASDAATPETANDRERRNLDKVVAHLNARRARTRSGGARANGGGGGVLSGGALPDARALAFFCFKFWQQLAAAAPAPASSTPSPAATPPAWNLAGLDFAFDVVRDAGAAPTPAAAAAPTDPAEAPPSPSPPRSPLPLPAWAFPAPTPPGQVDASAGAPAAEAAEVAPVAEAAEVAPAEVATEAGPSTSGAAALPTPSRDATVSAAARAAEVYRTSGRGQGGRGQGGGGVPRPKRGRG